MLGLTRKENYLEYTGLDSFDYATILKSRGVPDFKISEAIEKFENGTWHRPAYMFEAQPYHRLHISTENETMVAYFKNPDSRVPVMTKPCRYITAQFENKYDIASAIFSKLNKPLVFVLAKKPNDFVKIYTQYGGSSELYPSVAGSCMRDCEEFPYLPTHPAYVYGSGEITIMAMRRSSLTCGRSMFPSKTKIGFSRVYGGGYSTDDFSCILKMIETFADVVYGMCRREGALDGCCLLVVESEEGRYVCPYIDDNQRVSKNRDGDIVIGSHGALTSISCTSGDVDFAEQVRCDSCGDYILQDDAMEDGDCWYCHSCFDDKFVECNRCGNHIDKEYDDAIDTADGVYCSERCANRDGWYACYNCGEFGDSLVVVEEKHYCCNECAENDGYNRCDCCLEWVESKRQERCDSCIELNNEQSCEEKS